MSGNALGFELTADGVGFMKAIDGIEKKLGGLGGKVSGDLKGVLGGLASYEAFKGLMGASINAAIRIKDLADQSGITTDEVQRLEKASGKAGLSFDDFAAGLSHMGAARQDAVQSNQKLLDFFNKYGVSLSELMDPQLRNIDIMQKLADAADGVNMSFSDRQGFKDLFGKSGDKLLAAMHELRNLGPIKILSEGDIAAFREVGKDWAKFKAGAMQMAMPVMKSAARDLSNLVDPGTTLFGGGGSFTTAELNNIKSIAKGYRKESGKEAQDFGEDLMGAVADAQRMLNRGSPEQKKIAQENIDAVIARGVEQGLVGMGSVLFGRVAKQSPDLIAPGEPGAAAGSNGAGTRETPIMEQWRQLYDFLDREAALAERVKKIRFDMLSPLEQQERLQSEINKKLEAAAEYEKAGDSRLALNKKEEAAALNEQLLGSATGPLRPAVDSSTSGGGFIGGSDPSQAFTFYQQQISIMQQVAENTAAIARDIKAPGTPAGNPWGGQ